MWAHLHAIPAGTVCGVTLKESELVAAADWPSLEGITFDDKSTCSFERVKALVTSIRTVRADQQVKQKKEINLVVPSDIYDFVKKFEVVVCSLAGINSIRECVGETSGVAMPFEGQTIYLVNLFDKEDTVANTQKIQDKIAALEKQVAGFNGKLTNESYLSNAPDHVVQETRDLLAKVESELESTRSALK